jgi:3-oxoacyl-[acyl-carrier-protein] synthase III
MDIAAVAFRVPSRKLSNGDIIARLDQQNPSLPSPLKRPYLDLVRTLLDETGAETRYVRDVAGGESAQDLVLGAIRDALQAAAMQPGEIDLLIYCGVGRGFLEPANAYFFAEAAGMSEANCFDITDACMSWVRALHIAHQMLSNRVYRNIMIINGEFHLGIHDNWRIEGLRSLRYTFPMYTIGEAATATILSRSDRAWKFSFLSRPQFAELCTIPLHDYESFCGERAKIGLNGVNVLTSWGKPLLHEGKELLRELLLRTIADTGSKKLYFPHAPSETIYSEGMLEVGIPAARTYLRVYREFGNLVSASLPVGLSCAACEGALQRGDDIALVPVSAGLVAAVVEFTF